MIKRRLLAYCIALCLCSSLKPSPAFAETLFEDNFDDGVLDNWTVARNFSWGNMTQPCHNWEQPAVWQILLQRLGIIINSQGCFTEIVASSLHIPADQGYAFEFDMTMPESMHMDRSYSIKFIDVDHDYGVTIMDSRIAVVKGVAGSDPPPNNWVIYPFEADHTYRMRNEFGADNSIKIYVDGELLIDTFDNPPFFSGGTVGFQASVGSIPHSEVWFDNVKVTTLDDPRDVVLDVPYYSQRDPRWASEYYDTAEEWSEEARTSIERWGCALTSAVMALQYHNITNISPTIALTPLSLNTWLKGQPDGYVGDGLVNWITITRLTKQFSTAHPSVAALEYTYANLTQGDAQRELENQQPFIVELPKHFVLARGVKESDKSLYIHDPLTAERTTLPTSDDVLLSARVFTPSFTDLSYILAVHDPSIEVEILDTQGNPAASHQESLEDDLEGGSMSNSIIHQIAKPADGTYTLTVHSSATPRYTLDLYFYDKNGEVQTDTIQGSSSSLPARYTITYAKGGTTTVERVESNFLVALKAAYQNHEITSAYAYYSLLKIAEYREAVGNEEDGLRYTHYLHQLLEDFSQSFSEGTKERLAALL